MRKRLACMLAGSHTDVTEQYEIESPFSGRYVYHAEVRTRVRCQVCGRTKDKEN